MVQKNASLYPKSLADLLDDAAERFAHRTAFVCGEEKISFHDFDVQTKRISRVLSLRYQRKPLAIAILLPNTIGFVLASAAVLRAGYPQVNLNPLYTVHELRNLLRDCGARVLVSSTGLQPIWQHLLDDGLLDEVVVVDREPAPDEVGRIGLKALMHQEVTDSLQAKPLGATLALLQYTGGTTGQPKAAMLSHANLMANQRQIDSVLSSVLMPGEERTVTALPLYHVFAFSVNFILFYRHGFTNHLVPDPRDVAALVQAFKRSRPTVITGVNTLYKGLLAVGDLCDLTTIKLAIGGGAAIQKSVSDEWQTKTGAPILEGYGLSETSPVVALNPPDRTTWRQGVGLAVPETEVSVFDATGSALPTGTEGELCVRGPQVMQGYWNRPDETANAFFADGWFRTGDVGRIESDGQIVLADRLKDLILVSGLNVYPNEVEEAVAFHPDVTECACVGRPDTKTGEAVTLFVVTKEGSALTAEEIKQHCKARLAPYKVPTQIVFLPDLPKSAVGKILRAELKRITK